MEGRAPRHRRHDGARQLDEDTRDHIPDEHERRGGAARHVQRASECGGGGGPLPVGWWRLGLGDDVPERVGDEPPAKVSGGEQCETVSLLDAGVAEDQDHPLSHQGGGAQEGEERNPRRLARRTDEGADEEREEHYDEGEDGQRDQQRAESVPPHRPHRLVRDEEEREGEQHLLRGQHDRVRARPAFLVAHALKVATPPLGPLIEQPADPAPKVVLQQICLETAWVEEGGAVQERDWHQTRERVARDAEPVRSGEERRGEEESELEARVDADGGEGGVERVKRLVLDGQAAACGDVDSPTTGKLA